MSGCKHENADHMMPGDIVDEGWPNWPADFVARCEQFRCLDCGTWFPLGSSNDDSEAVRVEMRAAELATERVADRTLVTSGYLAHEIPRGKGWEIVRALELDGWAAHVFAPQGH